MYCWRIVNWTVCLFAVRLCTAGGLWTELCVCLQWGCVMLADCELKCVCLQWVYVLLADCELYGVFGCSEVMYCWRIVNWTVCLVAVRLCTAGILWTELCVWLQWGYILLADCELNGVSGCSEVMYCWQIVIWTVCFVVVRICTPSGLRTELCVWLQWGYVLLADCELNCVFCCSEFMYC